MGSKADEINELLDGVGVCIDQTRLCIEHGDAFQAAAQLRVGKLGMDRALDELLHLSGDALDDVLTKPK